MVSINTNISSFIAQNSLKKSTLKLNNAIEQMTTGYKINHAKDNAANYSIAVDMSTKIGALQVAEENCAMALDLVNTANEAYDLIADKFERIKALQNQYNNDTYGYESKNAIEKEYLIILKEMLRIQSSTEYNGIQLLHPNTVTAFNFQIGTDETDASKITVVTSDQNLSNIISGLNSFATNLDATNQEIWDNYLSIVTTKQTELGAVQNRLESALEAISTQYENLVSSRSTIKDTDVADVSSEYIKQQILQQASSTLLATANQSPALALQLL